MTKPRAKLNIQLQDALEQNHTLHQAYEHTQTELAMVQRRLDDIMYINLNDLPGREEYAVLPTAKKRDVIRRLRILRQENPLAKQAMKLAMRFTFGRGVSYVIKNKESRKVINQFWLDPENQAVMTSHRGMKARFDEKLTDGEKFLVMFKGESPPYVKLGEIPMEEIVDVITHPDNRFVPVYYKRKFYELRYDAKAQNGEGEWVRSGEGGKKSKPIVRYYKDFRVTDELLESIGNKLSIPDGMIEENAYVKHTLVNPIWTKQGYRGLSELFASREWFRVFKEFMEDRGSINAAANTFSYVRKIKGGQSAVASISGKIGGLTVGSPDQDMLRRMTRPVTGAIYDTNEAVDIAGLRADTGAVDAKEDARMILMTGGAGVGTMLPYFGEGGDANLATAQAMELPMVKAYEDYQTEVKNDLDEICMFVLETHYGQTRTEAIAELDSSPVEEPSQLVSREQLEPPAPEDEEEKQNPFAPDAENLDPLTDLDPSRVEDDRFMISWQMPPIISQDVVKYMSAWTQLAGQVAPENRVVRRAVIRGALTTMDVPNVESMMDLVDAEELRAEQERMRQKELMAAQFGENPPQNGENGKKATPAPDPLGPDLKRIANGKPPRIPATGGRLRSRQGL